MMRNYAVLMAGGIGTRFWPRSRRESPKQVLNIIGKNSMIQATFKRLKGLVDQSNIYIVTNPNQENKIREQLAELSVNNFVLEPFGRNTAPCIGLAAVKIVSEDPDGIMVVLPADHLITDVQEFQTVINLAIEFASKNGGLVTIGISPTFPSSAYGYIQRESDAAEINGHKLYKVRTFAEKPNIETAELFLSSGDFYWNSGMFIWKASTILEEISDKLPEIYEGLMEIKETLGSPQYDAKVEEVYRKIRGISIDYGVMQTSDQVYVIPAKLGWNDVGSWEIVYDISEKDNNRITGEYQNLINVDSSESYIYSPQKLVALVGIKNVVVVDTGDALLICKKSHSQDVKEVVEQLIKKGMDDFM